MCSECRGRREGILSANVGQFHRFKPVRMFACTLRFLVSTVFPNFTVSFKLHSDTFYSLLDCLRNKNAVR
jgi:hypothetical protein